MVLNMKHIESEIQALIVKYLQAQKHCFCSIPNEAAGGGKGAVIRMAQLKTLGLKSGAPDILVFAHGGKLIALEVKTSTGVQSPAQKHFQNEMESRGHKYYVVRSVQDVEKVLDNRK
jgi:hypothetical protein